MLNLQAAEAIVRVLLLKIGLPMVVLKVVVRYSPLTQIDSDNVKGLEVAWTFRTGEIPTENDSGETTNQVTPD